MKFLLPLFILISFPLFAAQSIVILPFSNESKTQQANWLGEGFAEYLTEELLLKNAYVIQRLERKAAYDALRLPYIGHVSRATMLKIGENLGADYIVFGSYTLNQNNLKVEARIIESSSAGLGPTIAATGSLDRLYNVQAYLNQAVTNYFIKEKLAPSENKVAAAPVPLQAYELYIKGLLESSDAEKAKLFQRAANAHPNYSQAIYRLGLSLFRSGRYKESNDALKKMTGEGILRQRADFLSALNLYYLRDLTTAAQKWYQMSQQTPAAEIYNNIGIALVGTNELDNAISYLSKAVELDPENPDFRFNLAIAHSQKRADSEAIRFFKEAIVMQPADYQSFYWLGKTLERAGKPEAKQVFAFFQERLPGDQKGKFPEQYTDTKQLLRPAFGYVSKEEKEHLVALRSKSAKQRSDYLKTYQGSARKQLEDKHPDRAILDIKKGLTFGPFDWYLHYLWGLAFVAQGNRPAAVSQLQFSIWSMDNIDSHIVLAEMYRESQQYAASKKHVQQILALDPKHKKAIEIWGKISNKN